MTPFPQLRSEAWLRSRKQKDMTTLSHIDHRVVHRGIIELPVKEAFVKLLGLA